MSARRSKSASDTKTEQTYRKYTATTGGIQRNQENFEHQISEEKALIPNITDEKDDIITSRKGIADVFGKFYSKLFAEEQPDDANCNAGDTKMRKMKNVKKMKKGEARPYQNSQNRKCKLPLTASKKEKLATTTESKQKTARPATTRQKG